MRLGWILTGLASATLAQTGVGVISTIAGTGQRGFNGDGPSAITAQIALANVQHECDQSSRFEQGVHIAVDGSKNVYFSDSNNQRIRRITPQGAISTVAGSGQRTDTNVRCEPTGGIGDGGPATAARLYNPADVVVHPNGNLIIVDQQNNRIRQVDQNSQISIIVGSGLHAFYAPSVPPLNSGLDWPVAAAIGPGGLLYFIEVHSNRVARVGAEGRLATVAGTGFPGFGGDGGPATSARLSNPTGLAFDATGNLYIADQANHRIRKVAADGTITTIAGAGQPGFAGDGGPAAQAQLNQPADVEVDAQGNIYVADMANHRVRRISPAGTITTVAGNGQAGRGPDGVPAASSSLNSPASVAVDGSGDLYIVDWQNYLIRKVSFSARPAISQGGIVNGASFAPFPVPVAPGSIVSIFGINLAPDTAAAAEVPLPTQLAGASVRVGGALLPLFFVSPGQINAQLPVDLATGTASAVVINPSGESAPESFNVARAAAGIFQSGTSNRAVVLNQDNSLNGPDNPEARGNVIVAFLTGQGPVNPTVSTGQAAPFSPLSPSALPVTASIGRVTATVHFLGLAPGFVGLAQANVQVPAGAPTGDQVFFISIDGQASNTTTVSIR